PHSFLLLFPERFGLWRASPERGPPSLRYFFASCADKKAAPVGPTPFCFFVGSAEVGPTPFCFFVGSAEVGPTPFCFFWSGFGLATC
ncbi:MAG TPA: hypothetical protein PLW65_08180, partial [Pseudomonadota bacterium]|nr:hypothetical protein [Pseudomonadota bacterium]